jgi:cellulose synthase (UDP-forming)
MSSSLAHPGSQATAPDQQGGLAWRVLGAIVLALFLASSAVYFLKTAPSLALELGALGLAVLVAIGWATSQIARPAKRQSTPPSATFGEPALDWDRLVRFSFVVVAWCVAIANFWWYWLTLVHVETQVLFWLMSAALFYESTLLPSAYLFFLRRMRTPTPAQAPAGLKVAMITLCVPSKEALDIIERQIVRMVAVEYPHETWVLDEDDDPRVQSLCARHGAIHFSRKNVPRWNQPGPPFQAKTKAGNVNAWLFQHGVDYEFFTQMDIDHNPAPDYLHSVLGYFRDHDVGWVQAPSVYANWEHWTARGASEQELVLQGPLQMGFYGFSNTPFIIGSHSTYRTSAMLQIGGMQPTRAEDHLDTVVLAQHGHRGVYVPRVIARGLGPESLDVYLMQQFAWAYSMVQVLFQYSPRYFKHYGPRSALQFLFVQTWYPLWAGSMFVLFVLPLYMLVVDRRMAAVGLGTFLVRYLLLMLTALGIWWWSRRWFQPKGLLLSWRGMILQIARWPVVICAFLFVLLRIRRPYMITPKGLGKSRQGSYSLRSHAPLLLLIGLSLGASSWFLLRWQHRPTEGYLIFAIQGAASMLLVLLVGLSLDMRRLYRERTSLKQTVMAGWRPVLVALSLTVSTGYVAAMSVPYVVEAVTSAP